MTRDDREIVSALSRSLAGRVGRERYDLWFGRGVELRVEGSSLHVLVGEPFRLEYLRRQFRVDLDACWNEVMAGAEPPVFALDPSVGKSAEAPKDGEAGQADEVSPQAIRSEVRSTEESPPKTATAPLSNRPFRRPFASLADFVVGPGSQVAFSAAQNVLGRPGQYSPLTLVGPPGCGKTHLLEGIWRQARHEGRLKRIIYLSAEQFTNHFLEAIRHSGTPNFRRKYRDVELLLIDDVQFFPGKQSTIVELVHTVDTLVRDGRQVVFAADRPPAELRGLGSDLVARLSAGLVCTLQPADATVRLKILEQLAAGQPAKIPQEVLTWLAAQLAGDARHLSGAINRLAASSEALNEVVTLDFCQTVLADLVQAARRPVRVPEIVDAVCDLFGVESDQLQSSSKSPSVALPRMLVMFLARKYTRSALSEIGRVLGRRSHSTVVSAQNKVGDWLATGKRVSLVHGECSLEDAIRRVESRLKIG